MENVSNVLIYIDICIEIVKLYNSRKNFLTLLNYVYNTLKKLLVVLRSRVVYHLLLEPFFGFPHWKFLAVTLDTENSFDI